MEFKNTVKQVGGLKISVAVIEKVAKIFKKVWQRVLTNQKSVLLL